MAISFECAVFCENEKKMIFPAWEHDMVYVMDLESKACERLNGYVSEGVFTGPKYGAIGKYKENILIFAPLFSKRVYVHDREKNSGIYLDLKGKTDQGDLFFDILVHGDYAYLLPGKYDAIVKINMTDYTVEYFSDIVQEVAKENKDGFFFRHGFVECNGKAFAACLRQNRLLQINLENEDMKLLECVEIGKSFTSVCSIKDDLYVLEDKGNIYRYDACTDFWALVYEAGECRNQFCEIVGYGNRLIALPLGDSKYLVLEKGTSGYVGTEYSRPEMIFFCAKLYDGRMIYSYDYANRKMKCISMEDGSILSDEPLNDGGYETEEDFLLKCSHWRYGQLLYENGKQSLEYFIKYCSNR